MPAGGAASSRARVPAARSTAYVTLLTSSATASMESRFAAKSTMMSTKLFFDSSLAPLGPKITAVRTTYHWPPFPATNCSPRHFDMPYADRGDGASDSRYSPRAPRSEEHTSELQSLRH